MRLLLIAAFMGLIAGTATAAPTGLIGDWRGEWTKGGDHLPVTITIAREAGGFTGMFSSGSLQVADIPLGHIKEAGEKCTSRFRATTVQPFSTASSARIVWRASSSITSTAMRAAASNSCGPRGLAQPFKRAM